MMNTLSRWIMALVLLLVVVVSMETPATAQGPQDSIEALALRAHLQNIRTSSYTFWIGGNLGDPVNAPLRAPIGERLEGWELRGFAGDEGVTLADLARPTVLNFWASWCPPCRAEFPHLVSVALAPETYAFDVLFVNMSDEERAAMEYLAQYPRDIHTVIDDSDRLARRASVDSIPTTILIDTDGAALVIHVGIVTPTVADFMSAVAADPGVGAFVAADHMDVMPTADLPPLDAANADPLTFNERVHGTITDQDFFHVYRFDAQAGDRINAVLQADAAAFDAYLVLMAADGTRLAENDDVDFSTDSALEATIPANGVYLLVATRFLEAEGLDTGDYGLLVTLTPAGASGPAQQSGGDDGHIAYGDVVAGRISGNDPRQFYSFEGRAGDVVTLRVTHEPGGAPLRIEVKDTHLHRLAVSEESVNGETALVDLELPEDGPYQVTVMQQRSRDTTYMGYTLALTAAGFETLAPPTLAYGQTVSGEITDAQYEQRWTFAGTAGDVIRAAMTRAEDEPGGLDGYLQLLGPDGALLLEVDDTGDNVMPAITGYTLPADGVYTLVATRFGFANGFSTGAYSLALERTGTTPILTGADHCRRWFDPSALPPGMARLAYNTPHTGTLSGDHFEDWYIMRGGEGDVITLRMAADGSGLDPYVILTDASGCELAVNDDAGPDTQDAVIPDFALPAGGMYFIRATRYGFGNGPSGGAYTLVIETGAEPPDAAVEPVPLDYLQMVEGTLTFDQPETRYTFEGRAGDQVTISVLSGLEPALALHTPGGAPVMLHEERLPGETRANRIPLPEDGTYTLDVILNDFSQGGDYRLLLVRSVAPEVSPGAFAPAPGPDIELVLVWAGGADLDLSVLGGGGGWESSSANDFCAGVIPAPVERMIWPQDAATPGLFQVEIVYRFDCAGTGQPAPFTLAVAMHGEVVDLISGALAREGDRYITTLEYRE